MEASNLKKYLTHGYLGLTVVYVGVMLILCSHANSVVADFAKAEADASVLQFNVLSSIQKPIATTNIIFLIVHLALALVLYVKGAKKALAYLPALIFSVFTLYCYTSLSGVFFSIGGNNASLTGTYWLMFFIGLFFIAGAITITVIGVIAARNLLKRTDGGKNNEKINN